MTKSASCMDVPFDAVSFRRQLHKHPELSGKEVGTAKAIADQLTAFGLEPITGVGGYAGGHKSGHGVLCVIAGDSPGETTLLRADFDAVPVTEQAEHGHVSINHGIMHACGHDGHTATLLNVAYHLRKNPPARGTVILLFQPAEEIGTGAVAMLDSPDLKTVTVDHAFAFHNLPGHPLHQIVVRDGTFACASSGICIELLGKTSHAAYPENGISPVNAMVEIIQFLQDLPDRYADPSTLATIVQTHMGDETYGVAPGAAKIRATLRSACNVTFRDMQNRLQNKLEHMEQTSRLTVRYAWHEPFQATVNAASHVDIIRQHAAALGLSVTELEHSMRWSEDFAEFLVKSPGAYFGIGGGQSHAELHNPDYDFPDDIIKTATTLFLSLLDKIHGQIHGSEMSAPVPSGIA